MKLISTLKRIGMILALCIPVLVYSQEICDNGIDDDADGLIDCYDPDCGSNPTCDYFFFGQPDNSSCQYPQPGLYNLDTAWTGSGGVLTGSTPVAGDIDNDGVVEIVVCRGVTGPPNDTLFVFNGNTGAIESKFTVGFFSGGSKGDVIALGDVDNDGFGEIIIMALNRVIYCMEHDGTPKWNTSAAGPTPFVGSPFIADFNQDGNPEVVLGNYIFNGQTGALIASGTGDRGEGQLATLPVPVDVLPTAFCADCGGLELVAGEDVYSVNIGTGSMTIQVTAATAIGDGLTSVADYDLDGDLDAIVVANGVAASGTARIFVWDIQTSAQIGITQTIAGNNDRAGAPTIGDFDNDGRPEIGLAGFNTFKVIDDVNAGMVTLWSRSTTDPSATTGSALFDFEGDGEVEVVYRDEGTLFMYRGSDGAILGSLPCGSGTITERPIIVDVDSDGEAEICVTCANPFNSANASLVTVSPAVKPWLSARRVWNQAGYFNVNVNDDLSIPQVQQDHSDIAALNGYYSQSTLLDTSGTPTYEDFAGNPLYPAPDGTGTITSVDLANCGAAPNTIDVNFDVTNISNDLDLPTGTPVSLYNGNPFQAGATYIATVNTTTSLGFNAMESLSTTIPDQGGNFTLAIVVNDSGTGTIPITEPVFLAGECDFTNNLDTLVINGCSVPTTNNPPVATNDTTSTNEDTTGIDIVVLGNDTDPDLPGDSLVTTNITNQPPNGTATINPDGSINYVPDPNFNGTDSLQYVVCDTTGPLCDTAWVIITVNPVNDPPQAVNNQDTTDENTPITIDIVANDSDSLDPLGNIDPTSVDTISGTGPANGSVTIDPVTGEITYTPDPNFNGTDTFDYVVCDDGNPLPAQCDTATVTIVVNPLNNAPQAVNDADTTNEDTPVTVDVVANDSDSLDPLGGIDPTTVDTIPGTGPANGTVTIDPVSGEITYTPDPNFNGTDTFDYVVCDSGNPLPAMCDTATVTIVVDPVNDPPLAVNDRDTTEENIATTIDVVANDADSNDPLGNIDPATVDTIPGSGPTNGTVTIDPVTGEITYTPNNGFTGNDTLQYVVCDDGNPLPAQCDTASVFIVVTPFNDPPIATNDADTTDEETPVTIDVVANDDDPNDALGNIDPTTVDTIPGTGPANGTVTIDPVTGEITYTPDPNFNGTDTFDYVVCDDGFPTPAKCDTATVTVVVNPINDAPQAVNDADTTNEDTPVTVDVVANDSDSLDPLGNIDPTTVDTIPGTGPANGTVTIDPVTGEITYTPDPNFNGTDTFDYVVCDDGNPLPSQCDTATVTIVVNPLNDQPVAVNDADTTDEDTPVTVDVTANDSDPNDPLGNIDPTTVDTIPGTGPANGTVSIDPVTGEITYTPDPGFNGNDTFDYVVCDDGNPLPAQCDTATVSIVVNPVNSQPVAVNDADTTNEDTPVTVDVAANDSDPNDPLGNIDPTTVDTIPGTGPANGTVSIDPVTGEITYTPDPNFNGTDTFDYVVCDDGNPLPAQCDTATVTIVVNPLNDQPVAVNDADTTDEDTPVTVDVTANDSDPNDPLGNIDPTTVDTIPGTGPANGTVSIDPVTGEITYTPDPGFNGNDTFDYVVCDDGNPLPAQCDTATVNIVVNPVNDQPIAVNDADTTNEDTPVTVDVVANDSDPNDPLGNIDPTTVDTIPGTGPANGTVSIDPVTGEITYTPDPNFNGTDTFDYVVCDDGNPLPAQCDTATVTIVVNPLNDQPVAVNDADTTDEDTPVTVDVTANDSDPNDPLGNIDPTTVDTIPGTGPANGTVSIDPVTGEITYTPDPGFSGNDTFDYVVCDDGNPLPAQCDTATVNIVVNPVNDQPVAVNDADTTNEDTPVTVDVVANDSDPNDPLGNIDPTTVDTIPGTGPANGTVSIDPVTGEITYTPDPNFNGTDTFDYVVCDDGNPLPAQCDTATVTIVVNPLNDQPVAVNDADTTDEDTPVTVDVTANDSDPNDPLGNIDPTTVDTIPGTGPANGTVSIDPVTGEITYTPDPGFNGNDTFDYVVCDDGNPLPAQCDTATVNIVVNPVNDQPIAVNDADTTNEDTPVTVDVVANDSDPNDPLGNIDPTTVDTIPGTGPANGTVSIDPVTGEITYTPDPNFNGTDTFDYVVCDDGNPLPAQCDTATVTIVVNPLNDQPVAVNDADTTDEDTPVTVDVTANDSDPNDPLGNIDPTTVDTIPGTGPANGTVSIDPVTGEITYTPNPGFNGNDTFDYVVCDDGNPLPAQCDTATVNIVVNPVNDQPIAVNDADTTNEDTPVTVDVTANDSDPNDPLGNIDPTTVDTIPGTGPANGTVSIDPVTGEITYTPDPNFNGTDTFDYVVCDDGNPLPAQCDTATVTIVVNPVNDHPLAVNDADTTDEDTPVTVDVVANDSDSLDPLGNIDPTTVDTIPGTGPANGTVAIDPVTGEITYTPDPGFNGNDTFDYVVCDDGNPLPAQCDTATVNIVVNPVNDQPIAVNDADTTNEDTPVTVDVVANDSDPNDPLGNIDPTTVDTIPGTGPANGTVSIDPVTGEITYTPDPNFNGTDTFDYVVCDDGNPLPAQCDTATVTIVVNPVNDQPLAVNDADTTDEDTPVTVNVVANDSDSLDPLGNIDPTTVDTIPGTGPANGTVAIDPVTGEITYTPNPGFNGNDTFDYVVCDDGNPLPAQCDTATVNIVVNPVNDQPIAVNDADTTNEDTPVTVDVVANDSDPNDPLGNIDPTTVDTIPGTGPANGTVSIDPVTGEITYTPDPNFNGTDTFDYVVCDDGNPLPAQCDTATVTIVVNPVNDQPVAVNDADTTDEETPVTVDVVANDSDSLDPLGNIDPTTVDTIPGTGPANGTVTIDPVTGEITYTPDPNFNGTDTFDYVVCDDGNPLPAQCDTATVTIVVNPVNDQPIAVNDADTTDEDTPVTVDVVANDSDSLDPLGNIDPTTVDTIPGTGPANGSVTIDPVTGEITYTPDPNFNGTDTFDYVVCDDGNPLPAQCDTATVTIVVNPVNDQPLAVNDADTTDEETPVTVDVVANDSDSLDLLGNIDPTTVDTIPGTGPANGTVTIDPVTGEITYTPDPNFNGTDTFDYVVCDDGNPLPAQCDTATVTIVVNPVNDQPIAVNDADTTDEDTPVTVDVVANDSDSLDPLGNIDPTTVDTIPGTGPANGTVSIDPVTGEITYTPDPNFNGTDTFDYVVCDDGNPLPAQCDTATVTIVVNPVNDAPMAVNDADTTDEETPVTVDVVANDSDSLDPLGNIDPTTVDTIPGTGPANGTVTIDPVTGEITYTPDPNFNGIDTFDYVVCDDGNPLPAQCDTATVTIVVNPVNDPPVAIDDADSTDEDTPVTVDVVANDSDSLDPLGGIDPTTVDTIPGSGPTNGTVTIDPVTGEITYTPDPNFNGTDTFDYVVCDSGNPLPALCDTATVTIVVNPVNDAPMAVNDADTTDEETPVTVDVVANDSDSLDPLGNIDPTTVDTIPGTGPANGTVSIDPVTGEITYTPDPNFNGIDTFDYVVCDDGNPLPAQCDTATITIVVNPVNDPPVAIDDADSTDEDTPVTVDVVANDSDSLDPLGGIDPTTVDTIPGTGPTNGTVTIDPVTGEITYTPDPNFNGTDTFDYVVCDSGNPLPALCDTATVTIVVNPVNDAPMAVNDADTTDEETPVTVDVVANDSDSLDPLGNIDPTTVDTIPGTGPANGTVSIDPVTGEITYTPDPNFNGIDTFDYVVCDDGNPLPAQCDTATVTIVVNPVNDPPVAIDDADSTDEDTPVTVDVVANDSDSLDPLGGIDPTTVDTIPGTGPTNGTVTIDPVTGEITYTPDPNFNGTDTFDYVVCDSGNPLPALCDTATVTIVVNPVNDAPMAVNDADTTDEETPVTVDVVANDSDSLDPLGNIDPTTVDTIPGTGPANGTVSIDPVTGEITYTPDPNFNGIDTFDYVVCDDGNPLPAQCDTATVTIVVNPVNDPPVAIDDADSTDEDTPVTVDVVANDSDSLDPLGGIDPTTVDTIPGSGPTNGTVTIDPVTGEITYTPDPNFNGVDMFDYVVCDSGHPLPALCDTATVTIVVNPVNDAPFAVNDVDTTNEETPVTVDVVANDSDSLDPLGGIDPTTVDTIPGTGPANGTVTIDPVTGEITYTPDPNFNGTDTFDYVVCDSGHPLPAQCDTATVTIVVLPVNDPPVAVNDVDTTGEETPVTIDVVANDNDSLDPMGGIDPTTVDTIPGSGPSNGTVTIDPVTGEIIYTPDPNFNGVDMFDYVVCDSGNPLPALCDTATVTIVVNPVNDPPVAVNDVDTTDEDTPVTVDVVANDSDSLDPLGGIDPTTVDSIPGFGPSNGTITIDPVTGEIIYTPDPNFTGVDSFLYVVCDSGNPAPPLCDTAMVTIVVNPVNDPPVAVDDSTTMNNDSIEVTIDVLANDTDPDLPNDSLVVTSTPCQPANGSVMINANGTITYTPTPGYVGVDSFCYVICDTSSPVLCDTAWVYVTVTDGNDPPVAVDDSTSTTPGTEVFIPVTINDSDPDGDGISVTAIPCPPSNGVAFIVSPDSILYIPNATFIGRDTFCYVICDSATPPQCDTAFVYVDVVSDNNPPVGQTDTMTTNMDSPVVIGVLFNDSDPDQDSLTLTAIPCPPSNGTALINANGTITYTPGPGFTGLDSLCYVICDDGMPPLCDTVWVYITVLEDDVVFIPNGFTPNDDGENDFFVIKGIDKYPNAKLLVFNRWGNVVFEEAGYLNDWGGWNSKKQALPDGTYYYVLDLADGSDARAGFVLIFR